MERYTMDHGYVAAVSVLDALEKLQRALFEIATSSDPEVAYSTSPIYRAARDSYLSALRATFGPKCANLIYDFYLNTNESVRSALVYYTASRGTYGESAVALRRETGMTKAHQESMLAVLKAHHDTQEGLRLKWIAFPLPSRPRCTASTRRGSCSPTRASAPPPSPVWRGWGW